MKIITRRTPQINSSSWYLSEVDDNPWICCDFKRRVIPTSYSVKAEEVRYGCSLTDWVIEVSNDGTSWKEVDRRENNHDLSGKGATANFRISRVPSESFRFFRLKRIEDFPADSRLVLGSLEIFGTLFEESNSRQSTTPMQDVIRFVQSLHRKPSVSCLALRVAINHFLTIFKCVNKLLAQNLGVRIHSNVYLIPETVCS